MQQEQITSSYLHKLQAIYHDIDNRGICIDPVRIEEAKIYVDTEINRNLSICSNQWNCHVFIGRNNSYPDGHPNFQNQVNINSSQGEKALLRKLQDLGYKVPKIAKRNEEGEYEAKYSTGELALQKMLVTNQFNFVGGDPAIRAVLQVRELGKLRSSYLNCRLYKSRDGLLFYLSNYNCAGTLTGRRSSRKHTFGFGNNAQNFPKHGKLSKVFRKCLISRPGRIFLLVDQKGAEEWPVNALAQNITALQEMQAGVNRHIRRASRIFSIAETARTEKQWKDSIEYYLGKKTGHANNYGMQPQRMSDSLAQEGHSINPLACKGLLDKLNALEPSIRGIFHPYVKDKINKTRILRTPFGRERQFLGLRPNDNNHKVFNEAYAYIPQSVVGDNTGFGVAYLSNDPESFIIQESHDSIVQDISGNAINIWTHLQRTVRAFERTIRFDNGISIEIPVEAELGYNFADTVKIKEPLCYEHVVEALTKCNEMREKDLDEQNQRASAQRMIELANSISVGA